MKSCPYCRKEDLHDEATRCPHCGAWLSKIPLFRKIAEIVGWVFLAVFVLGLGSCGVMLFLK